MRILITLMILALACLNSNAQRLVEEKSTITNSELVKLELDFADDIVFKTWNKNEVYVKASVSINDNSDNDAYSLKVTKSSTGIGFQEKIKDLDKLKKSYKIDNDDDGSHITHCSVDLDIQYEVYVPAKTNIKLKTISGNIEAKGLEGELDLNTISGDIDFTIPQTTKADLDFSTISGEMYTDFDFSKSKSDVYKHHFVKMDFNYELNGGGRNIELTTISGNIYFRKL